MNPETETWFVIRREVSLGRYAWLQPSRDKFSSLPMFAERFFSEEYAREIASNWPDAKVKRRTSTFKQGKSK